MFCTNPETVDNTNPEIADNESDCPVTKSFTKPDVNYDMNSLTKLDLNCMLKLSRNAQIMRNMQSVGLKCKN